MVPDLFTQFDVLYPLTKILSLNSRLVYINIYFLKYIREIKHEGIHVSFTSTIKTRKDSRKNEERMKNK